MYFVLDFTVKGVPKPKLNRTLAGHLYLFYDMFLDLHDAKEHCEKVGARLPVLDNMAAVEEMKHINIVSFILYYTCLLILII